MKAEHRGPARFTVKGYSAAFKRTVVWKVEVTTEGITARRQTDGREVAIDWRSLLGAAMLYGVDREPEKGHQAL